MPVSSKKLPRHSFIEIAFAGKSSIPSEEVRSFLVSSGVPEDEWAFSEYGGEWKLSFYTRSFGKARQVRSGFVNRRWKGISLREKILGREEWLDKWNDYFKTGSLGRSFLIVPMWEKDKSSYGKKIPVRIDPQGVFGTGCHETTRLMVRLMEGIKGKFQSFFDAGTGTGILSVIAVKLGAARILGIDNDGPSVKTARYNFKANGCHSGIFLKKDLRKISFPEAFDLTGANQISHLLIEEKSSLLRSVRPGYYLALSGILKEELESFLEKFKSSQLKIVKIMKSRKWAAVLYRRIGSVSHG